MPSVLNDGRPFQVEAERGGERLELTVTPTLFPYWWWKQPISASLALTATFLLLRARRWHLARRFFAGALFFCVLRSAESTGGAEPAFELVAVVARSFAAGFLLSCFFEWTEAARPLPTWQRVLSWAIGLVALVVGAMLSLLALPTWPWLGRIAGTIGIVFSVAGLLGLARAYRRAGALERRQLRWVLSGLSVWLLPVLLFNALGILGIAPDLALGQAVTGLSTVAIPLGIAVSIVGYQYLDIDRLISATAAFTILGIALLRGTLALVPHLAQTASVALGLEADATQFALSMALAALLVPAYRALRPWLDQRFFAEQHALTQAFERLRGELAACRGLEELAKQAGEGLDALLRPDSIATYARAGGAFTPLFVRGRAAPPAFEAESTLVQVLEKRGAPLFTRAKEVGPFERAALETLGAEVVVPVLRDGALLAFNCLATKRSGDIYTATDLANLAAIADRCSDVLARLDADEVAREAQVMQSALRRYVPGAVAERVLRGDTLEPAEREVTVLVRRHPRLHTRDGAPPCGRRVRDAERTHRARVADLAGVRRHDRRVQRRRHDGGVRRA